MYFVLLIPEDLINNGIIWTVVVCRLILLRRVAQIKKRHAVNVRDDAYWSSRSPPCLDRTSSATHHPDRPRERGPLLADRIPAVGVKANSIPSNQCFSSLNSCRLNFFTLILTIHFILKIKLRKKIKYIIKLYYIINYIIVKIHHNYEFCFE
jgi:hypothetical protein